MNRWNSAAAHDSPRRPTVLDFAHWRAIAILPAIGILGLAVGAVHQAGSGSSVALCVPGRRARRASDSLARDESAHRMAGALVVAAGQILNPLGHSARFDAADDRHCAAPEASV